MRVKKKRITCTYNVALPNNTVKSNLTFSKIMLDKADRLDDIKKEIAFSWGVGTWNINITDMEEEDV
jgi:hypothetical protein